MALAECSIRLRKHRRAVPSGLPSLPPTEVRAQRAEKALAVGEEEARVARTEKKAAEEKAAVERMGHLTKAYWERCIQVNKQFVTDKSEVWFKEFRPTAVGRTCREVAKWLREIDTACVDPEVIDHAYRVVRGFEQMGAIAETKGRESLWRAATAAVGFVIKITKPTRRLGYGLVADGGSLAMGIGASDEGGETTRDGQAETLGVANKLMESEEDAIRHVRKAFRLELKPW